LTNLSCRATASKILNEYLAKVGGKEAILEAWQEKKEASKKGKKRGRAGTGADATNGTKRGKKNGHPKDESPPTSASKAEWKPPTGNWEDLVTGIDACEGNDNNVVVYLTWKGGHKTQHPLAQVYKRCPQKVRTLISTIHHAILTDLTRC
jgi:chromobox protein 1